MSGLEIAGVVLAVIPVVQLALKRFQGEKYKSLVKYQQAIGSIGRKLGLEHAQLHSTCFKLLKPIFDEVTVAELLADPKAAGWQDGSIARKVEAHLGETKFELYVSTLRELAIYIAALREDLGLEDFVSLHLLHANPPT
jgi:hypothetical protein